MPNMKASTFLKALEANLGRMTQTELASALGVSQGTISNWANDVSSPPPSQIQRVIAAFARHTTKALIKPIFEYREIHPQKRGNSWSFGFSKSLAASHKSQLLNRHGIYIYFSSAGAPIYVGKSTNCLFLESKARLDAKLNRPLRLPSKRIEARVGHIARFASAYEVTTSAATKNIESFLLRAFANGIFNVNSGHFQ